MTDQKNINNSPKWIKQAQRYFNDTNNYPLTWTKKIHGINLLVSSNGHILNENFEKLPTVINANGYVEVNIKPDIKMFVHTLIAWTFLYDDIKEYKKEFGENSKYEVNHRDNIRHNNAIKNLIISTPELNKLNKGKYKNNKGKYKGVYEYKTTEWEINKYDYEVEDDKTFRVFFKGKPIGIFKDETEAANAYDLMLISYIHNKYKSIDLINEKAINIISNLEKFKNNLEPIEYL